MADDICLAGSSLLSLVEIRMNMDTGTKFRQRSWQDDTDEFRKMSKRFNFTSLYLASLFGGIFAGATVLGPYIGSIAGGGIGMVVGAVFGHVALRVCTKIRFLEEHRDEWRE
jgi:hypothetical protein